MIQSKSKKKKKLDWGLPHSAPLYISLGNSSWYFVCMSEDQTGSKLNKGQPQPSSVFFSFKNV